VLVRAGERSVQFRCGTISANHHAKLELASQQCQHDGITNLVWEAIVFTGILRWVLGALLLATNSTHLLAQRRDLGVAPTEASEQRLVLVQVVVAPTTVQNLAPTPQRNELQRHAAETVFRDCADCPEMVVIQPGSLTITTLDGEAGQLDSEAPQHTPAVPTAIGVGKYEVTKAQFARFVQESGYSISGGCFAWNGRRYEQDASKDWRNPGFAQTDNDPVVCVNWTDAKAYAEWLTKKTKKRYRLPTETEWEYAARAGTQTSRPWGQNASDACRYANVADARAKRDVPGTASWTFHECDDNHAYTAPVGSYPPNAFGLYDMLGNAWEWTESCVDETPADAPSDGRNLPSGTCEQRVLRGGGWVDSPAFVSYDFRFRINPNDRDFYSGFRVVRTDLVPE
jgi:formylglycine-generating enzyme required for sulfatase activity